MGIVIRREGVGLEMGTRILARMIALRERSLAHVGSWVSARRGPAPRGGRSIRVPQGPAAIRETVRRHPSALLGSNWISRAWHRARARAAAGRRGRASPRRNARTTRLLHRACSVCQRTAARLQSAARSRLVRRTGEGRDRWASMRNAHGPPRGGSAEPRDRGRPVERTGRGSGLVGGHPPGDPPEELDLMLPNWTAQVEHQG
jgi:hypothetical protein